MTILVTGAGGMIGRALCRRLAAEGRKAIAIDRAAPADLPDCIALDTAETPKLQALMQAAGITRIVHAGAISGPMVANQHPEQVFAANILGTQNLLEAARHAGVKRIVFLSSLMAYGPHPEPVVDETASLLAADPYGGSKICGEALLRAYDSTQGIDGTSLRVAMVYGPWRATNCVVRDSIRAGFENKPLLLPFGRGWHRQYIHVEDVVDAIVRAVDSDRLPRPAYNVTAESRLTLDEIAAVLADAVPGTRLVLAGDGHPHDYPLGMLSGAAAREDFGFAAAIPLAEGLRRYADHLLKHQI